MRETSRPRKVCFTGNALTDEHGDLANVLRQLETVGMEQAMEAGTTGM
ncbi:hypothetical protein [Streptomyces sp. CB02460]|nr:hypothetical protein [Streptomyces sp. CB02460]